MSKKNNKKIIKRKHDYAMKLEQEAQVKREHRRECRKENREAKETFKEVYHFYFFLMLARRFGA